VGRCTGVRKHHRARLLKPCLHIPTYSPHAQDERHTVDPVRGAKRQRAVKRAKAPPVRRGGGRKVRVVGGTGPVILLGQGDADY